MQKVRTLILGCLCLLAAVAWGQSYLSSISGTVLDATGASIPNAKVVATETKTNMSHEALTNAAGDYVVADLAPGRYLVTIAASGFKELKSNEIILIGSQNQRFDGRLEVGTAAESIEVSATAPTINTQDAQIVGLETRDDLTLLPTNQRSTITLFMLSSYNYHAVGSSYSLGGLRGNDTNFTIDGTTSNSNTFGAQSGPQTEVSFESLRDVEFRVSNNSAEYGQVGTVVMETRSGENQFHGSAFYSQVNGYLDARSFFASAPPSPTPAQHQMATSFGGPVWIPKVYNGHNRTFFYFTWEENRFPGLTPLNANVPTAAFRTGDFSSLLGSTVIMDPTTGNPFPGNVIPTNRLNPVSLNVQSFLFPQPNVGPANSYINNWGKYDNESDKTDRYSARIDHVISTHDNLSTRFTIRNDPEPLLPDNDTATLQHTQYRRNMNAYIGETHVFSPTLVNEFRIGFSRDHSSLFGAQNGNQLLQQFGILGATPNAKTGAPEFDFTNFMQNNGDTEFSDYFWTSQALEFLDNVTYVKGRHNLKMGVNIRRNDPNISNNPGCDFGCYSFDGSMTGFDYADFLLGIPANTTRNFRAPVGYARWTNMGLYVQDDYKLTPKLTLNLGLRWEYTQPASDKNSLIYTFDPATDGVVVPNQKSLQFVSPLYPTSIPVQTAQQAGYPSTLVQSNWKNFGPRVAFAYRPFGGGNFVIRGGYGVYYSPLIGTNIGDGIFQGGPYGSSEQFFNTISKGGPCLQFPDPFTGCTASVAGQTADSLSKSLRTPYVQQWNLTAEREIKGNVVVRATYRGFRADQLAWSYNLNTPPASTNNNNENTYFPYPNFYKAYMTYNGGITKFNGMDLSVERKFTSGFTFQSGYTLAKNQSDVGDDGERNTPENAYDRARDFGNVSFMPRNRWVSNVLYDLPFGKGKQFASNLNRFADMAVGGWTVSSILVAQSGQFLDLQYSGVDILNNRNKSGRPDCIAGQSYYPSNQSIGNYLNAAAFALPAIGDFGTCPRNAVNGPGITSLNLSLQKSFHLSEKATFKILGVATNALNHPIFRNENTNISSGSFGQITSVFGSGTTNRDSLGAAGSRLIQIGGRIDF
jgi:outer membrane receptor protein involved in Fe transport